MKKQALFLFSILAFFSQTLHAQPTRRALLIAVGTYAPNSGWPALSSNRDADLLSGVLVKQGFSTQNIHILRDAAASRTGIEQALQTLAEQSRTGDAVLIHFSGHGQQVADDNRDEADGYDEALVPYDSPMLYQAGKYEGAQLLRDDALGHYVQRISRRLGPAGSLLVLLDACHSGTGLRGDAGTAVRGTDQPMADEHYQNAHRETAVDQNTLTEGAEPDQSTAAPVVAFFAASAHESNYETRDETDRRIGALSYAFCKAFANAQPGISYRTLFDQIKTDINSQAILQNPQAEGPLDRRVLDGRFSGFPTHFDIKLVADQRTVLLASGLLAGLTEGSELAFYPPDTQDTIGVQPITLGKVESSDPLESVVAFRKPVSANKLNGAWVFLRKQAWRSGDLRVQVDLPTGELRDSVRTALRKWQRVILVEKDADFWVGTCSKNAQNLCLNARGQSAERTISKTPNQVGPVLVQAISDLAMANFLRGLSLDDAALQARLGVIPNNLPPDTISATLSFRAYKDTVALRVTNVGRTGCYYTLIDIQPDGQINVALPEPGRTAADYFLKPGAMRQFDFSWFAPPTGTEVFKLIASREPLDLRQVVQTRGTNVRGMQQPNLMFSLLAQRYDTSDAPLSRGTLNIAPGGVTVTTLVVRVE